MHLPVPAHLHPTRFATPAPAHRRAPGVLHRPTSISSAGHGTVRRAVERVLALVAALAAALALAPLGTAEAAEHVTAAVFGDSSSPQSFFGLPDRPGKALFLAAADGQAYELWVSDGTAAGTRSILSCTPACGSLNVVGGSDGVGFFVIGDDGRRLGRTDGSAAGTRLLPMELEGERFDGGFGLQLFSPKLGGVVFLTTNGLGGSSLWLWDGSPQAPRRVSGLAPSGRSSVGSLVELGDRVHLLAVDQATSLVETWATDGTAAGTVRTAVIGIHDFSLSPLHVSAGRAAFVRPLPCEIHVWTFTDTTPPQATEPVQDSLCRQRSTTDLQGHAGRFYVLARDFDHDLELYATDGGPLVQLTDLPLSMPFRDEPLLPLGDRVLFTTISPGFEAELWASDGTPGGTGPATDLCPDGECDFDALVAHRGVVYLGRTSPDPSRLELWRSDGTTAGTRYLGAPPQLRSPFIAAGDSLFLITNDPGEGVELWHHPIGTTELRQVSDFELPEALGGHPPSSSIALGNRLLFGAEDPLRGSELWISDGTTAGTRLLVDIAGAGTPSTPPKAPRDLVADASGASRINLFWNWPDRNDQSGQIHVELRSAGRDWEEIAVLDAAGVGFYVDDLAVGVPHSFRLRVVTAGGTSPWSETVSATTGDPFELPDDCVPSEQILCFGDGRFGVEVAWWNQHAESTAPDVGVGRRADAGSPGRTGYFWFFRPDNVELIVKMLDGGALNGHYWTFYGALTDVGYWITVRDHWNHTSRTYHNPPEEICGLGDTESFFSNELPAAEGGRGPAGLRALALDAGLPPVGPEAWEPEAARAASHPVSPCVPDANTLCLLDDRFRIRVRWRDQHNGGSGVGGAVPFTDRTGFFWFFREDNVELVVKVLDGRPVNGKIWVFYGALSDVGYTLVVEDTATGHDLRTYVNEPGNLCGDADTAAF